METKDIGNFVFTPALKHAIAETLHEFIAASMMPTGAVVTISMKTKIDEGHHCVHNGDSFYELFDALNIDVAL